MQPKIFWIASLALLLIMLIVNAFFVLDLLTSDLPVELFIVNFILFFPLAASLGFVWAKKNFGYYLSLVLGAIFLVLYAGEFIFTLLALQEALSLMDFFSFIFPLIIPPALLLLCTWKSRPVFQETNPGTHWNAALITLVLVFLFYLASAITLAFYYSAMVAAEYFTENLVYIFNSLLIQGAIFIVALIATAFFFFKKRAGFYLGLAVPILLAIVSLADLSMQLISVWQIATPDEMLSLSLAILGSIQPGLLIILFYCIWKAKPVFEEKKHAQP
ncbi:MAG: hypothetical protein PHD95_00220 [Candidatus ainarchaeum sp.]|nr:hypothetical protein [Candidatus ainarchaeum sp.]